jgi:hypothetical protein
MTTGVHSAATNGCSRPGRIRSGLAPKRCSPLHTPIRIGQRIVEQPVATLPPMAEPADRDQLERFWLRLRREAHELYREAGMLRGRIRELERALSSSEHAATVAQQENERLKASVSSMRTRLRAIEGSRGWKAVRFARRLRRGFRRPQIAAPSEQDFPAEPVVAVQPPAPEPTFAQRWAAEAAKRAAAAERLNSWGHAVRESGADVVVIVAGDPGETHTRSFVEGCVQRGEPVCEFEAEDATVAIHGFIPPDIQPSLVPDVLRMDLGAREKIFVCTSPGHAAIRWLVPAQQDGWATAVVVRDLSPSPELTYLATHADAVFVGSAGDADALEATTRVRALVRDRVSPDDVVEARRSLPPPIPRQILGIE